MLKLIHVLARLSVVNGLASVKQMSVKLPEEVRRAEEVIAIFQRAAEAHLSRTEIEARLAEYTGARLDYREIDGLAKVISDSFAVFKPAFNPFTTITSDIPEDAEDEPESFPLSQFRLAVWREVARPENYPFNNPNLTAALRPGVQSLRRAAAAHDEDLLTRLMPAEKRAEILEIAAQSCGISLDTKPDGTRIGELLFADLPGQHRLLGLKPDLDVENLLNRYNIELLRGALYLAPRLKITVRDKYKDLFKFIKLFGLMHEVKPLGDKGHTPTENEITGYEILLEGATSPFLARSDRRYGLQFARFLPALLLCEAEWKLESELVFNPAGSVRSVTALYRLGPQPHLRSHFKGSGEFDSLLEENLAIAFEEKFKTTTRKPETAKKPKVGREGWTIQREDRIISVFDTVMIPDFAFEHTDGRRALLEIVGFWERGYLERKIAKLNRAGRHDFIVLVSERTRCGRESFLFKGEEPPYQLIFFKGTPRLGPIMEALERCAV